jgi:hypothetical protein
MNHPSLKHQNKILALIPIHADQIHNVVRVMAKLFAHVSQQCSVHHPIAVPNVLQITNAIRKRLATINDVKIHAKLAFAD